MRPIKLELEGFTSFRQKEILNFAELDLFAITGPTGAGKSSLLDAITYALFGRTPRLGKSGNELMSQGLVNMSVRLEFQAGNDIYQVFRGIRGSTAKGQLEKKSADGKWIPETSSLRDLEKKIEQIVGLTFEGFTRAVILPQGKFDEFLRGDLKQRREVLKDLLSLKIFEKMMQRANIKAQEMNADVKRIESQIAADITEEKKQEAENSIAGLKVKETVQAELIERLGKGQEIAEELSRHRTRRENIQSEQENAEQEARKLNSRLQELQAALVLNQEVLSKFNNQIAALAYDPEEHLRVAQLLPHVERLIDLKNQLEELQEEQKSCKNQLDVNRAKKDEAEQAAAQASKTFKRDEANLTAAKQQVEDQRSRYGLPQTILSLATELKNTSALDAQLSALQTEIKSLEQELAEKEKVLLGLNEALVEAEKMKTDADQVLEELKLKYRAIELRHGLHAGEACPVCEQIVTTLPQTAIVADLEDAKRAGEEAQKIFEKARQEAQQAPNRFVFIEQELAHKSETANNLTASIAQVRDQAKKMVDTESDIVLPEKLEQLAVSVEQSQQEFGRLEHELKSCQVREFQCRSNAESLKHQCESNDARVTSLTQQMERLQKEWAVIEQKLGEVPDFTKLQDRAKKFDQAKKQKENLEQHRASTLAKVATTEMEMSGASQLLNAMTGRIAEAAKEFESCTRKISATENSLKKAVAPIALNVGEESEQLKKELNAAHDLFRELSLDKKEQELVLKSIIEKLKNNDTLREESKRLKSSAAVYHELGNLLSADRFQDYMLRSSYRLLAREGSRYFEELTGGRYSFQSDGDQFSVRDHANGDELRSVSTLSGGESFLASLALALALSQSIRDLSGERGAVALESLFLDEGFSTLDPETLGKVADALPALQKKGRLIGVITHVEALAEQLPSRVEVEKTPTGSRIIQSSASRANLIAAASA